MKVSELKEKLNAKGKEDLIKDILDLFKKNQFVKDYYISQGSDNSNSPIFLKHKDIIEKEFFPERGDKTRLSVAQKAISEFKKLSRNNVLIWVPINALAKGRKKTRPQKSKVKLRFIKIDFPGLISEKVLTIPE